MIRFKPILGATMAALLLSLPLVADEKADLEALGRKLKAAVAEGKMTEAANTPREFTVELDIRYNFLHTDEPEVS